MRSNQVMNLIKIACRQAVGFALLALVLSGTSSRAHAFEMVGLVSYNIGIVSPKPATYTSTGNGVGYAFLGRLNWGPGLIESGFLYTPTSVSSQETFGEVKVSGAYWIFPLMYRFYAIPRVLSIAAGGDYALVSNTNLTVGGSPVDGVTTGYKSHFGVEASIEAAKDMGENLSLVLDVRYRAGLGNALYYGTQNVKYNFTVIAVGLQKFLD
jgi:hypothetical protein